MGRETINTIRIARVYRYETWVLEHLHAQLDDPRYLRTAGPYLELRLSAQFFELYKRRTA
jgi:hypothetical protein